MTETAERPHVVANEVISEAPPGDTFVYCEACGSRLSSTPTARPNGAVMHPPGTLIGTDCPGVKEAE
jgi:hypothetical protein